MRKFSITDSMCTLLRRSIPGVLEVSWCDPSQESIGRAYQRMPNCITALLNSQCLEYICILLKEPNLRVCSLRRDPLVASSSSATERGHGNCVIDRASLGVHVVVDGTSRLEEVHHEGVQVRIGSRS